MKTIFTGLVGDVGGTNARFALVDSEGHVRHPRTFPSKDYASLTDVITEYLNTTAGRKRPPRAAIAVAGPVTDGESSFTNLDWQISEGELLATFDFEAVELLNDFAAQALACPRLDADDLRRLGPDLRGDAESPMLILGAGTGFGAAALARSERGDIAVATEAGHAGFAPTDEVEAAAWKRLLARYGRVSIERILSGKGLHELYEALGEIAGTDTPLVDDKAVTEAALTGDPLANETLDRFCAILGSVAGDLALSFGARGGVYVSGGIAPRMADRLATGGFRARFEDKGRLSPYVADIPTFLVLHPYPAMVGAARALELMGRL